MFVNFVRRLSVLSKPNETIYALSSGKGRAGVAVIRLSGGHSFNALKLITQSETLPSPRKATLRNIYSPTSKELLDRALILTFPGPASFTGEDVVELHVHGGNAITTGVLNALSEISHLSPAEPGEFTKRAFLNDKMDLTQAEGLADLINAETEWQRRQALRQIKGELGEVYQNWRHQIIQYLGHIEAHIDFGEDQLDEDTSTIVTQKVEKLRQQIVNFVNDNHRNEILRDGIHVTIMGLPNAGKSSLLNQIVQRNAAIVSPIAGTTRDVIEVAINLGGFPVLISDTAGLAPTTQDIIEIEGIKRASEKIQSADLKVLVIDASSLINEKSREQVLSSFSHLVDKNTLVVLNKIDLGIPELQQIKNLFNGASTWTISCETKKGISELISALISNIEKEFSLQPEEGLGITNSRHRHLLQQTITFLDSYQKNMAEMNIVFAAEDLRHAASCIGKITGKIDIEEILDVVFRDFCIGK